MARQGLASKEKRAELFGAVKEAFIETLSEELEEVENMFQDTSKAEKAVRDAMLDDNIRLDGHKFVEFDRPVWWIIYQLLMDLLSSKRRNPF